MSSRVSFLVLLLAPLVASAAWKPAGSAGSAWLQDVSAADWQTLYTVGYELSGSGISTTLRTRVYRSTDAGGSFQDVSGEVADGTSRDMERAVFALDAQRAWASTGSKVWRTTNGGTSWSSSDAGFKVRALHFFDESEGVAVGNGGRAARTEDGGASWSAVSTPASSALRRLFFLPDGRGWALGHEEDDETRTPSASAVLRTDDEGRTWQAAGAVGNVGLSSVFFLCDGETGWLTGFEHPDETTYRAKVWKTTDGGSSWATVAVPLEVGKLQLFGSTPINTGKFLSQHWADEQRGRLSGLGFVGSSSEGSSGGGQSSTLTTEAWKVVDYVTSDGGATWTKTDLGSISVSFGAPLPSDGAFEAGAMRDLLGGWLVGAGGEVWTFARGCDGSNEACGEPDYGCWRGSCLRDGLQCPPECGPGEEALGATCVPVEEETDGGTTNPSGPGDGHPSDPDPEAAEGGCSCGSAPTFAFALLALLLRRRSP